MLKMSVKCLPHEHWTEAFDGYYISDKGRWYSAKTKRLLKQSPNSSGYMRAELRLNGKRKWTFTHIKVVECFGDCNGRLIPQNHGTLTELGLSIDHKNRDKKKNNKRENLELVTHVENCLRKFR